MNAAKVEVRGFSPVGDRSMAAVTTTARDIGKAFARAVSETTSVIDLWVSTRRDGVHLWLVVGPIEDNEERRLYSLLDTLDDRFPEADFQLHILNPLTYEGDPHDALPVDAEQVPLIAS